MRAVARMCVGVGCLSATFANVPARQDERPAENSAPQATPDDATLRAAWATLDATARGEIAEWFRAEVTRKPTFQNTLIRYALKTLERAPYDWPEAPQRAPLYDARTHAPGQPIVRRFLSERSSAARSELERMFAGVPTRRLGSAWRYDYAGGDLQRVADHMDPTRIFENGLAGAPPDLDLAEALVERMLDDGSERAAHAAFAHAYADRTGRAFPGITLYDAWCSGEELEMPDVECLGVLHDLEDDWQTFVAPVPEAQHEALYDRLGARFTHARRQRGLRHALARVWLTGDAVLRDGYAGNLLRFHALWERHSSTPSALAAELPDAAGWEAWLRAQEEAVDADSALWQQGLVRRATLRADAAVARSTLVAVMREFGALER